MRAFACCMCRKPKAGIKVKVKGRMRYVCGHCYHCIIKRQGAENDKASTRKSFNERA